MVLNSSFHPLVKIKVLLHKKKKTFHHPFIFLNLFLIFALLSVMNNEALSSMTSNWVPGSEGIVTPRKLT